MNDRVSIIQPFLAVEVLRPVKSNDPDQLAASDDLAAPAKGTGKERPAKPPMITKGAPFSSSNDGARTVIADVHGRLAVCGAGSAKL